MHSLVPSEEDLSSLAGVFGIPMEIPYHYALLLAVLMTLYRYILQALAWRAFYYIVPYKTEQERMATAHKASESLFKLIYYTFSWLWSVEIIRSLGIWDSTIDCIQHYPYPRSYSINGYYLWELAFYISGLFCHFTLETRRNDFVEMAVHHVVTIGLIFFSFVMHYERIGLIVLALHDIADIFLEAGKILNYMGQEILSTIAFIGLILSWIISRLYYFPFKVIRSAIFEHYMLMDIPYCRPFIVALFVLQVLHIYWFHAIMRVAYRKTVLGELEDVRENEDAPNPSNYNKPVAGDKKKR